MTSETPVEQRTRTREEIPESFTWNLSDIYPSWTEWEAGLSEFERKLTGYVELRGTLAQGPERLLQGLSVSKTISASCRTSSGTTPA